MREFLETFRRLGDGSPEASAPSAMAEDDRQRSRYMRYLIQDETSAQRQHARQQPPRVVVQFWDTKTIPADVRQCMDSWRGLEKHGFARILFDDEAAERFIAKNYGRRHSNAFERCGHPAMRSDYFRLCFLARNGGFYVDADDAYEGGDCSHLFNDSLLKLQPLCYDISTGTMVEPDVFAKKDADSPHWIFYVNNSPIISPSSHDVIRAALARATRLLLTSPEGGDIQSTTGPGNLTASLVRHSVTLELGGKVRDFAILSELGAIAVSQWPLSYRSDERNWRLWNRSL